MSAARPARGGSSGKSSVQVYIRVRPDLPGIDGAACAQMPHLTLNESANTIQVPDVDGPAKAYKCHRVFVSGTTCGIAPTDIAPAAVFSQNHWSRRDSPC